MKINNMRKLANTLNIIILAAFLLIFLVFMSKLQQLEEQGRDVGEENFDIPPRKKESTYEEDLPPELGGIYVREAYRVSNTEIRFVYLQSQNNSRPILAKPSKDWVRVEYFCFNKTCEDYLFCSMATRIGRIRVPSSLPHSNSLGITAQGNEEYFKIPLNDVRPSFSPPAHLLAVCMQPIFFYADWTLVIQFFESWLAQGATKFYFYVHSYTWQTKAVIDFYKESLGSQLEIIEWSDLPVYKRNKGDYWTDPNARVFRHAATAFMHDCMLRARGQAKYVANVDMDDLPFCSGDGNIGERLEEESDKKPRAAQFIAQWILSQQKQDWETVESPKNVRFELSSVRILNRNSIRWDYRVSKKIFHRPDRVIHFDMHRVFKNEQNSEGLEYEAVDISELKIFFLHLRRFERDLIIPKLIRFNESFDYSQLIALNHRMTTNYAIRMRNQAFAEKIMTPWAHEARTIMRNLEQCRREAFGTRLTGRNKMCQQSSSGCRGMLTVGDRFHFASMTWLDLTHTALFNSYVES